MKSIISGNEKGTCYLCGHIGQTEEHHIFCGSNRRFSESHGLKVYLCPCCHRDNKKGVHSDKEKAQYLHEIGQREFEKTHSHKEFMMIFGKNYLEASEWTN